MAQSIDLEQYRSHGTRVFAGRDRGDEVRTAAKLEVLDQLSDAVDVLIPEDVFSVNSSFFLAMFGPSIRKLGEARFRAHYRFLGKDIQRVIDNGIREALSKQSPF